jgi:hypothetical protein
VGYAPKGLSLSQRLEWTGWSVTETGCWEWSGGSNSRGYGQLWFRGRVQKVHRLAYEAWVGVVPDGMVVRHLVCDNPPCINPDHLAVGTQKDNVDDRDRKGRRKPPSGELNGRATLTTEVVNEIRRRLSEGETVSSLARAFDSTLSKISHIKNGVSWREERT